MVGGKEPPAGPVRIFDCDGYYMAVSLAEKLASEGRRVTIVTPLPSEVRFLVHCRGSDVHRTLKRLGVEIVAGHVSTAIEPERIRGRSLGGDDERTWDAESVVLVTHRVSDRLYRDRRTRARISHARASAACTVLAMRRAAADRRRDLRRPPPRA